MGTDTNYHELQVWPVMYPSRGPALQKRPLKLPREQQQQKVSFQRTELIFFNFSLFNFSIMENFKHTQK